MVCFSAIGLGEGLYPLVYETGFTDCRFTSHGLFWYTPLLQRVRKLKTKLCGLSLQANYTDRVAAACQRSYCQLLRVEGVAWSAQRIPTAVNLGFLDWSCYFFIQVAPQLSSRGCVDPIPDPLLLRKSGRARNRTQDLWICSQKLWPLDHRGGPESKWNRINQLVVMC
jgi:hypothetical protein